MSTSTSSSNIFSRVPYDVLAAIVKQVGSFVDFIAFAGVCMSWRSAAIESKRFNGSMLPHFSSWPWLMLAENNNNPKDDGSDNDDRREFYSLSKKMIFKVKLPEANDKRCFASNGRVITIARDLSTHLLHPLSRIQIKLPYLNSTLNCYDPLHESEIIHDDRDDDYHDDDYHDDDDYDDNDNVDENLNFYFVHKAVLSSSTSSNPGIVMVIYGKYFVLAFCRLGDDATAAEWTKIKYRKAGYLDVIHYKEGQFYAIDTRGRIVFFDVAGPNPTIGEIVTAMPKELQRRTWLYLVDTSLSSSSKMEMARKLLVVSRMIKVEFGEERGCVHGYETTGFQVFEVDLDLGTWTEVKNLGDIALFLGHNSSFYHESNSNNGIKPNSIYFADDVELYYYFCIGGGGGGDMGIYNLQDGSISPHFDGNSFSRVTPPMWITP